MNELIKNIIFIILLLLVIIMGYFTLKNRNKFKKKYRGKIILTTLLLILITIIYSVYMVRDNKLKENKNGSNNQVEKEQTTTTTTSTTTTTTTTTTTKKITTTTTTKQTQNNNDTPNNLTNNKTRKGYTITYKDGAYYIDNILIVNKTYKLTSSWKPVNPYKKVPNDGFDRNPLDTEAYEAWKVMKSDASSIGLNLWAQSGYRSYDYQNDLYNGYIKRNGKKAADTFSARPGASEHQTGLAFDLNTITNSFKDTEEGKWVNKNCYLYGYILRYPEGKTNETGYIYEPWHIRYVGKELAKKLYNNGNWITMEDYFGIDSKYND